MKCVILAAGRGTRMRPLTDTMPKPLIPVCGKPVLDHIVEALPAEITELIIVTSYLEEQIKAHCGEVFHGRKVMYISQQNPAGGTGDALLHTEGLLRDKFLVLNGDDIHGAGALKQAITCPAALIAVYSDTPEKFGVIEMNEDHTLKGIIEKPENPSSNLVNTGGFVVTPEIFNCPAVQSDSGEIYATDMLTSYAADHPVQVIEQREWIAVGCPEDITRAEEILNAGAK